jgi:hypothetical protein
MLYLAPELEGRGNMKGANFSRGTLRIYKLYGCLASSIKKRDGIADASVKFVIIVFKLFLAVFKPF